MGVLKSLFKEIINSAKPNMITGLILSARAALLKNGTS